MSLRSIFTAIFAVNALLLSAAAAHAGSANEVAELKFVDDDSAEVSIRLDSDVTGFRLADLVEGDARTATTADGQVVTATRLGNRIVLDIDGREFDVPWRFDAMDDADHGVHIVMNKSKTVDAEEFIHEHGTHDGEHSVVVKTMSFDDDGENHKVIVRKHMDVEIESTE